MGRLLSLLLVTPFATRACDYRPPSDDNVTIAFTEYPSETFAIPKYPNAPYKDTGYRSETRIRGDVEWDWIRIEIAYDHTFWLLNEEQRKTLKELIKTARDYFESTIKVKRLSSLQLVPSCAEKKPKRFGDYFICDVDCIKRCGTAIAPPDADYYYKCVCSNGFCKTNLTAWGGRLRSVDFMLFVSANTAECGKYTLAFASHCALEAATKRPVAGFVNICPQSFTKMKANELAQWEATIKHELIHAFVFSNSLYPKFRVPYEGVKPAAHKSLVVKEVERSDWESAKGKGSHSVLMIVTPNVRREAQDYFNCSSLEGAELESQGLSGTAGSHWEKRVFENEAMTGVTTQVFAISRITLALFEDSGWYQANYDFGKAENMTFGKGLGCSFAKQSCLTWIKAHFEDPYPFCRIYGDMRCTDNRKAKVRCNLDTKKKNVESCFDYNVKNLYVDAKGKPVHGYGSIELADFCPYYRVYGDNSREDSDTRCTLPLNMNYINYSLEVFSPTARCIELDGGINVRNADGSITWTHATGCYETLCDRNLLFIKTQKSKFYPCYGQGQLIHVKKRLHGIGTVSTRIICPNCAEICGEQHCAPERTVAKRIGDECQINNVNSAIVFSAMIITLLCFNIT